MGVLKVYDGTQWKNIGCGGILGDVGRLKLWDGTQWVREVCDDDIGDTQTFPYTQSAPTFVVPALVTSLTVECWGGAGQANDGVAGGLGGYIKAEIAVTPGESLMIRPGGDGTRTGVGYGGAPGGGGTNGAGDGGGHSYVRRGLTDYLVVAGGGGGAGAEGAVGPGVGGAGGGLVGGAGASGTGAPGGGGGGGGTQSAGGAGGTAGAGGVGGNAGSTGVDVRLGGNGGGSIVYDDAGGGGGNGWRGGGGGGASGSSAYGGGGGGGSSGSTGTILENDQGVRTGDGQIILTWNVPPRRPLKMWDGTAWVTVACMVPA